MQLKRSFLVLPDRCRNTCEQHVNSHATPAKAFWTTLLCALVRDLVQRHSSSHTWLRYFSLIQVYCCVYNICNKVQSEMVDFTPGAATWQSLFVVLYFYAQVFFCLGAIHNGRLQKCVMFYAYACLHLVLLPLLPCGQTSIVICHCYTWNFGQITKMYSYLFVST